MNKYYFIFSVCLILSLKTLSQQNSTSIEKKCATPVLNTSYEKWLQWQISRNTTTSIKKKTATNVYIIPIVFHVISDGEAIGTGRNISQAQIQSQIVVLNNDYRKTNADFANTPAVFQAVAADCEIEFCPVMYDTLGNLLPEAGIDRITRSSKGWSTSSWYSGFNEPGGFIDTTIKKYTQWDPKKYLNIWILEMNDYVLGYAQYPDVPTSIPPSIADLAAESSPAYSDGVVLDYRYVGTIGTATAPYNLGKTMVHEIGHWLGLRHIWGDDFGCSASDYCNDTPNQGNATNGCPTHPKTDACNTTGVMFYNQMDYSNDACLTMFTNDQKTRMMTCLQNCPRRLNLDSAVACSTTGVSEKTKQSFTVYPNPAKDKLYIILDNVLHNKQTLLLYNAIGELLIQKQVVIASGTNTIELELNQLSSGMYSLILSNTSFVYSQKLIIE